MRRREFIILIGGAGAAWPLAARAQQPTIPVIGFVHLTSPEAREREVLAAFHRGLRDIGYIEGRNVTLEYLWAQGQNDRLAPLVVTPKPDAVIRVLMDFRPLRAEPGLRQRHLGRDNSEHQQGKKRSEQLHKSA